MGGGQSGGLQDGCGYNRGQNDARTVKATEGQYPWLKTMLQKDVHLLTVVEGIRNVDRETQVQAFRSIFPSTSKDHFSSETVRRCFQYTQNTLGIFPPDPMGRTQMIRTWNDMQFRGFFATSAEAAVRNEEEMREYIRKVEKIASSCLLSVVEQEMEGEPVTVEEDENGNVMVKARSFLPLDEFKRVCRKLEKLGVRFDKELHRSVDRPFIDMQARAGV